jgi:hypothetical protein
MSIRYDSHSGEVNTEILRHSQAQLEAVIKYSQTVIEYGSHKEIQKNAERILKECQLNLAQVGNFIKINEQNPNIDHVRAASYLSTYEDIFPRLEKGLLAKAKIADRVRKSGIDRDYLSWMIVQYESMIRLNQAAKLFTTDPAIKEFAEKSMTMGQETLSLLYKAMHKR